MTMQNLPELTQEQLNAIIAQHYMQQMQMQQQQAAVNSFWNDVAVRAAAKVVARGLFR